MKCACGMCVYVCMWSRGEVVVVVGGGGGILITSLQSYEAAAKRLERFCLFVLIIFINAVTVFIQLPRGFAQN